VLGANISQQDVRTIFEDQCPVKEFFTGYLTLEDIIKINSLSQDLRTT
jgi:hypothetical protein